MKNLITLLLLISFSALAEPTHHVAKHEDDHGPNIPKVGSSLFDKIFSAENSNGDIVYKVPYPIGVLTEKVKSHGQELVHAMVPFSRSLQRPVDLSYNPILSPRLVIAERAYKSSVTGSKIFLGFVKARDQLEVISYNEEAGRFEYQIVKDYSKKPKVMYVNRGKCLSCHQNQAPIFSVAPWEDASFRHVNMLFRNKLGKPDATAEEITTDLFGPIASNNGVPAFDSAVRQAHELALEERIWVYGCANDRRCRLGLLLKTLVGDTPLAKKHFQYAEKVLKNSELKKQLFYRSKLSSHDMGVREIGHDNIVNDDKALLKAISNISNLSPENNPATKRWVRMRHRDLGIRYLRTFSETDIELFQKDLTIKKRTENLLLNLYEREHEIFNADAINKIEIMALLTAELGISDGIDFNYWLNKKTAKKELFKGAIQPVFQRKELNIFSQHCHKCHATGNPFPPQFLLGTELEVLERMKKMKPTLLLKLEGQMMPPLKSDRDRMKATGDMDRLIQFVKSLD